MNFLILILLALTVFLSWNIGANDASNSIGTAVGSKSISLRNAILLAIIFEFIGAVFFGSKVTVTIGKGILNNTSLTPLEFSLGMLASLISVNLWIIFSTLKGFPTSATHSTIGALLGFGIFFINEINYYKLFFLLFGIFLSPILGAIASYIVFKLNNVLIFSKGDAAINAKSYFPALFTLTFFSQILLFFDEKIKNAKYIVPLLVAIFFTYLLAYVFINLFEKSHDVEKTFSYLQILSACFIAFSHGSNDISNAIGPVWGILKLPAVPYWLLLLGATSLVVGIYTKGYKVIDTIGEKLVQLTPHKGYVCSFSASLIVLLSSKLGISVSTTHTLIGAIIGMTLAKGFSGINRETLNGIFKVWFLTIPATAIMSALIFAFLNIFN